MKFGLLLFQKDHVVVWLIIDELNSRLEVTDLRGVALETKIIKSHWNKFTIRKALETVKVGEV